VLKTRDTIARDLHDEVGSALTSISYLSEMGKIQNIHGTQTFDKIGETSRGITSLMNDIIWAINPDKDNAISLVQRSNYFIQENQRNNELNITFDYSNNLQRFAFSMMERKNLFLIFKEALNNAFKYAHATQINISLQKTSGAIVLEVKDNGQGVNVENVVQGNGLKNMKKRAHDIGASFEIISIPEKGTLIRVEKNHQNWST
jgi:signal transduction histidine kinase